MGAGRGVGPQQVAEEGVGEEVEHVSRDVPQHHGASAAVQARHTLRLQDAANAMQGAAVQLATGHTHRAQRDVGDTGHVAGQVQVLCRTEDADSSDFKEFPAKLPTLSLFCILHS